MSSTEFQPLDSLKTINEALKQAKAEKTGARFYYLLWGAILAIHFLLSYFFIKYPGIKSSLFQTLTMMIFPLGGLLSYLRGKSDAKHETALSLHERVYLFGFAGFALSYGTIFIASVVAGINFALMLFPVLLGLTVFVVGGITKHTVSIVGGVLGILLTGISLNCSIEYQNLIAAAAAFVTCVVPGYLMKSNNV